MSNEMDKQELVKELKRLIIETNAMLNGFKHIHDYVETYDGYDFYTAYLFIKSQLDQSKRHINKIEELINNDRNA